MLDEMITNTKSLEFLAILISLQIVNHLAIPAPCFSGWSYLENSKLCVKLQAEHVWYNATSRLCSSSMQDAKVTISPILLGFKDIEIDDFPVLDAIVGEDIDHLWFYVVNPCMSYKRPEDSSWFDSNTIVCGAGTGLKLPHVCRLPALTSSIDFTEFEKRQFVASSYYTAENTFGLLKHKPDVAIVNKTFSKGLFWGSGWCSTTANQSEYWQVDFDGRIKLSGFTVQFGIVNSCRKWISKFQVMVYNGRDWSVLPNTRVNSSIFLNEKESTHWILPYQVDAGRIRIHPLQGNSSCDDGGPNEEQFCLRVEFYGYYVNTKVRKWVSFFF